jgi:hypothetical protein
MSRRYEFGRAAGKFTRTPMEYYGPGTDFEEIFEGEFEPGSAVLTIGDPYASAYALEGTPEELRAYVRDLATTLDLAPGPMSCHVCGHIDQTFYQHLTSEHYRALNLITRRIAYDAENRCTTCGAHIADPHDPGCAADTEPED